MKEIEIKVKCPFYLSNYLTEENKVIVCEDTQLKCKNLYFVTDSDQKRWLEGICCDDYKSCSRYKKLMKSYDRK